MRSYGRGLRRTLWTATFCEIASGVLSVFLAEKSRSDSGVNFPGLLVGPACRRKLSKGTRCPISVLGEGDAELQTAQCENCALREITHTNDSLGAYSLAANGRLSVAPHSPRCECGGIKKIAKCQPNTYSFGTSHEHVVFLPRLLAQKADFFCQDEAFASIRGAYAEKDKGSVSDSIQ